MDTPAAAAEKADRQRRGFEDPEARCHLPGVPRAKAEAALTVNPTEYKDLGDYVQSKTGMDPNAKRKALLL